MLFCKISQEKVVDQLLDRFKYKRGPQEVIRNGKVLKVRHSKPRVGRKQVEGVRAPDGETEASWTVKNEELLQEHTIRQPNMSLVRHPMQITYWKRREDIIRSNGHGVNDTVAKYPFLTNKEEVRIVILV